MKELSLAETFCEVLSGLALLTILLPLLDILEYSTLANSLYYIVSHITLSNVGLLAIISYLLGLILDAFGLGIGEVFLDKLVAKNPPGDAETEQFWRNVSEHVLRYRDHQWTYYSCYRNLFIIFPFASVLFLVCILLRYQTWHLIFVLAVVPIEWALWRSMCALLEIYYRITRSSLRR